MFNLLTSTLIIHAGLIVRTTIIASTSNIAEPILTNLIGHAVIVAVANSFADSTIAPFVAQAISIATR